MKLMQLFQKLQDDLEGVGRKIKHHEENIRYLKTSKRKLDESIFNKQGIY